MNTVTIDPRAAVRYVVGWLLLPLIFVVLVILWLAAFVVGGVACLYLVGKAFRGEIMPRRRIVAVTVGAEVDDVT